MAESSTIELGKTSSNEYERHRSLDKGKTPIMEAPLIRNGSGGKRSYERLGGRSDASGAGMKRGISIMDFVVRLAAVIAALAATISMGTTDQTLPFFTQFFQFQARYDDLPTFTYSSFNLQLHSFIHSSIIHVFDDVIFALCRFFVIANAITSAYLVLSLPISIVAIVRPLAKAPRLFLITFDAVS